MKKRKRDSSSKVEYLRLQSKFRLKSAWETIIEKYERDFEGQSDVIDLATGKIIEDYGTVKTIDKTLFGDLVAPDEDPSETDGDVALESLGKSKKRAESLQIKYKQKLFAGEDDFENLLNESDSEPEVEPDREDPQPQQEEPVEEIPNLIEYYQTEKEIYIKYRKTP